MIFNGIDTIVSPEPMDSLNFIGWFPGLREILSTL